MKAKFGMIVVAGSGKIGGHVASRNRGGAYFRTKVTPLNPQTSAQSDVRSRLSDLSSAWRGLTNSERQSWDAAVSNYATTDIFGDIKNPSGFNLYMKLNGNLNSVSISSINRPDQPDSVETVDVISIIPDESSTLIPMVLSGDVGANTCVKVFATPPISPGKTFVKNLFRIITVLGQAETTPVALGTFYAAKFGLFATGTVIYFKLVFVNATTGQQVAGPQYKAVVVA